MVKLSKELRDKLRALRRGPARFDTQAQCFTIDGQRKHGLTKTLRSLVPVPRVFESERARRETFGGRAPRYRCPPETRARAHITRFAGATMRRCGTCKTALAAAALRNDALAKRLHECRGPRAHGVLVDEQLAVYVARGREALFREFAVVDPCVGTLLEHFDARGWALVATQVPLASPTMNVVTACDLLATDRRTRTQLHLIEIKATRNAAPTRPQSKDNENECDDEAYEEERGCLTRSDLRGMPLSFYARHQTQLCCMQHAALETCATRFDSCVLVRVAPGVVSSYDLNAWWERRSKRIANAVSALRNPRSAAFRARVRRRQPGK